MGFQEIFGSDEFAYLFKSTSAEGLKALESILIEKAERPISAALSGKRMLPPSPKKRLGSFGSFV